MQGIAYDESRYVAACKYISRQIVRPLILRYYGTNSVPVSIKDDKSVVTEADRAIEHDIRSYLINEFPGFGLIGEEFGPENLHRDHVWTIDPIDGTEAFVAGLPLFGTLLAIVDQTKPSVRVPIFGALYLPIQDQLVVGNRLETTLNGRPVKMEVAGDFTQKKLLLGNLSEIAKTIPVAHHERLMRLVLQYRSTQTWGDCLGYVAMLDGKAQARIDFGLGIEDIAPLEPIILGAGGAVTSWDGTSLSQVLSSLPDLSDSSASFNSVSAASRQLHNDIMDVLWI